MKALFYAIFILLQLIGSNTQLTRVATNFESDRQAACEKYVTSGLPNITATSSSIIDMLRPSNSSLIMDAISGSNFSGYTSELIIKGIPIIIAAVFLLLFIIQLIGLCCSCLSKCLCCCKCCCCCAAPRTAPKKWGTCKIVVWLSFFGVFTAVSIAFIAVNYVYTTKFQTDSTSCTLLAMPDDVIGGPYNAAPLLSTPPQFAGLNPISNELTSLNTVLQPGGTFATAGLTRISEISGLTTYTDTLIYGQELAVLLSATNNINFLKNNNHYMYTMSSPNNVTLTNTDISSSGTIGASLNFYTEVNTNFGASSTTAQVTRSVSWPVVPSILSTIASGFQLMADIFKIIPFKTIGQITFLVIIILSSIGLVLNVGSIAEVLRLLLTGKVNNGGSKCPSCLIWIFMLLIAILFMIISGVAFPAVTIFSDVCSLVKDQFDSPNFWQTNASSLFSTTQSREAVKSCFMSSGDGNLPKALGIDTTFDSRNIYLAGTNVSNSTTLPTDLGTRQTNVMSGINVILPTSSFVTSNPTFTQVQFSGIQDNDVAISDADIALAVGSATLYGISTVASNMSPLWFEVSNRNTAPAAATSTYSTQCGVTGMNCRINQDGTFSGDLTAIIAAINTNENARVTAVGGLATFTTYFTNGLKYMKAKAILRNTTTPNFSCLQNHATLNVLAKPYSAAPLTSCTYSVWGDGVNTESYNVFFGTHLNNVATLFFNGMSTLNTNLQNVITYTDINNNPVSSSQYDAIRKGLYPYFLSVSTRVNALYNGMQCRSIYDSRIRVVDSICGAVTVPLGYMAIGTVIIGGCLFILHIIMRLLYSHLKANSGFIAELPTIQRNNMSQPPVGIQINVQPGMIPSNVPNGYVSNAQLPNSVV